MTILAAFEPISLAVSIRADNSRFLVSGSAREWSKFAVQEVRIQESELRMKTTQVLLNSLLFCFCIILTTVF